MIVPGHWLCARLDLRLGPMGLSAQVCRRQLAPVLGPWNRETDRRARLKVLPIHMRRSKNWRCSVIRKHTWMLPMTGSHLLVNTLIGYEFTNNSVMLLKIYGKTILSFFCFLMLINYFGRNICTKEAWCIVSYFRFHAVKKGAQVVHQYPHQFSILIMNKPYSWVILFSVIMVGITFDFTWTVTDHTDFPGVLFLIH